MPKPSIIGLIAGSGDLPIHFARQAKKKGLILKTAALRGEASPQLERLSDTITWISVGQVGTLLAFFKKNQVHQAVMHGKVQHSGLFRNLRLDWKALSLWRGLKDRSGEALLKALAQELQRNGTRVLDARFLMGGMLAPRGWVTGPTSGPAAKATIQYGLRQARALARLGVGQSLLVKKSAVVAVEAMEGTDATIRRAGKLAGTGAILVKVSSPRQDWRFDIPTVGLGTLRQLVRAKAAGLVVESGKAFLLDREKLKAAAEKHGIFILAV